MAVFQDERTQQIRKLSKFVWPIGMLVIFVGDVFGVPNPGRGDTPSEVMRDWSQTAWFLPFFWGALTGHLFVNIGQPENYQTRFYAFAAIMVLVIGVNAFTYYVHDYRASVLARVLLLQAGVVLGVALWSQDGY